jgi:membrane-bound lytic murein transglycosylase D
MQQNWWYDGRRDIVGATSGALDYLEKLHKQFRDWDLALAAYNWGEGSVQRAQERNRKRGLPVNYASLKLPDETRNYVPKLLAIKNIVAQPEHFGLSLPDISNTPYFLAVSTAKRMDTELVAQLADISQEEFIALNPAHNRPVILQRNSDYILLPIDKIDTFQNNLESYDKPLVSWQAYHTKKGERLDNLAPRFGLSVERLKLVNSLAAQAHTSNGETLLVPLNEEENQAGGEFEAFNMHLKPPTGGKQDTASTNSIKFVTHSGDALDKLATRYHVSVSTLKSWHSHTSKASLQPTPRLDRHRQAVRFHVSKKHTANRSKALQRKA